MPGDIGSFETGKRTHADVVKLREQKRIDEMAATDCELGIIDCLFRDLESRRPRTQESTAASPIEFRFRFLRPRDEIAGDRTRNKSWPSITSGSRSLIRLVRRLSASCSDSSTFLGSTISSSSQPVLSGDRNAHDVIPL